MELRDYTGRLRRRWLLVLLVTVGTFAVAALVSFLVTPKYTAETTLFFALKGTTAVSDLEQGSNFLQDQMNSYAGVATSPLILGRVSRTLGLTQSPQELARSVDAQTQPDTVLLTITVTDTDAARSAQIANAVAAEVSAFAGGLTNKPPFIEVRTLAEAIAPNSQSSPAVARNLLLGVLVGLLLGVAAAVIPDTPNVDQPEANSAWEGWNTDEQSG